MLAADNTRNRRQVNDRPAAIGDHGRDRVLDAKEHPGGVNRHDPMPGFGTVEVLFGAARDAGMLTNTSSLPKWPVVAATTAAQLPSWVTSSGSNRAETPIPSATCRPSCSSTSAITTLAPSRANICAVAAPMPDAAPEMMATLPACLIVILPSLSGAQRPVNFGRRFSAKADTASWWSLVRFDCVSRLRLRSIIEWAS